MRWKHLPSVRPESVAEHLLQTAMFAHCIALHHNEATGESVVKPDRVFALAAYHDAYEVITEDVSGLLKNHYPELKASVKKTEKVAVGILSSVGDKASQQVQEYFPGSPGWSEIEIEIVKIADVFSALAKATVEYKQCENAAFKDVYLSLYAYFVNYDGMLKGAVTYMLDSVLPGFGVTFDRIIAESVAS